jgi:hypothetical protein
VRGLSATGVTVLLTTQYLEEADALAGQIAVVDRGTGIATGTPDELKARTGATARARWASSLTEGAVVDGRGGDASSFGLIGRYGGIRREGQRAYGPQCLPGDGERLAAGGQDPPSGA